MKGHVAGVVVVAAALLTWFLGSPAEPLVPLAPQSNPKAGDAPAPVQTPPSPSPAPSEGSIDRNLYPKTEVPRKHEFRRVTQVPQTPAEQQSMIDACLRPQAEGIAATLGTKYEDYVASIRPDQASKLTDQTRSLAWDLAQARIGWELAINEQVQDYVRSGRAIPQQEESKRARYIAVGTVSWGAKAGPIWGLDGAMVEISFAFTREDHPRLDKARETYRAAQMAFDSVFSSDPK